MSGNLRSFQQAGRWHELAANVAETSYVHSSSNNDRNYYWIVACNRGGC